MPFNQYEAEVKGWATAHVVLACAIVGVVGFALGLLF